MDAVWDIKKIQKILPQRYPFLFIDRVTEIDKQKGKVTCIKNVTINDYFLRGHFPGQPVMPGAIIIEAMAQASIVLYAVLKPKIAEKHPDYFLGKIEAKFKKPVKVGDILVLEVAIKKIIDTGAIVEAFAKVNTEVTAQAQISFGVKVTGDNE